MSPTPDTREEGLGVVLHQLVIDMIVDKVVLAADGVEVIIGGEVLVVETPPICVILGIGGERAFEAILFTDKIFGDAPVLHGGTAGAVVFKLGVVFLRGILGFEISTEKFGVKFGSEFESLDEANDSRVWRLIKIDTTASLDVRCAADL